MRGGEKKKTCKADQQRLMHLDHSAVLPPRSFDQSCFCPTQAEKKIKREKDCAGLLSDNGPFYREVGFVYTAH